MLAQFAHSKHKFSKRSVGIDEQREYIEIELIIKLTHCVYIHCCDIKVVKTQH